jgi:hypothetical protein
MAMELPTRRRLVGIAVATVLVGALWPGVTVAHPPLVSQPTFECANAGALRVTCHGSFVDGRSAAGVVVRVLDRLDHVVYVGNVDRAGRITFRKPDAEFHVVFDAGQGNVLTILGSEVI